MKKLPVFLLGCLGAMPAALSVCPLAAHAQVWAIEGLPWQFETTADKASKAVVLDIIERKKGGYYDAFQTTYNVTNNTYIRRQYNCGLTATATGSASDNTQSAWVSSPETVNTSGYYLDSAANRNDTGSVLNDAWRASGSDAGTAQANTNQSNTGDVSAWVRSSPSEARSGRIDASEGRNHQALNVTQSNTGNQAASLEGGTACAFGSGAYALN